MERCTAVHYKLFRLLMRLHITPQEVSILLIQRQLRFVLLEQNRGGSLRACPVQLLLYVLAVDIRLRPALLPRSIKFGLYILPFVIVTKLLALAVAHGV